MTEDELKRQAVDALIKHAINHVGPRGLAVVGTPARIRPLGYVEPGTFRCRLIVDGSESVDFNTTLVVDTHVEEH